MKFIAKLIQSLSQKGHLCVGLDSRYDRIPIEVKTSSVTDTIFQFNTHVIEATHEYAAAYKMNVSFYAGFGHEGLTALKKTNEYLKKNYPDIPLLADCKRSEMGESVEMVKREIFEFVEGDVPILLGTDSLSRAHNLYTCDTIINFDLPWSSA
ncbi:MAG: helicase-related protein, partial [Patescibacteria group bacterium]|nr:helicase-related protein [Patescibacteria group bacterium]